MIKNTSKKIALQKLHEIQNKFGYISESEIIKLAKELKKSPAEIYDEASFYSNFYFSKNPKKIIKMCQSPTCHMLGSEKLLKYSEELLKIKVGEKNSRYKLETCSCLGLCDRGPAMMINKSIYTNLTKEKIKYIFKIEGLI